jgi:hypothetical protein
MLTIRRLHSGILLPVTPTTYYFDLGSPYAYLAAQEDADKLGAIVAAKSSRGGSRTEPITA